MRASRAGNRYTSRQGTSDQPDRKGSPFLDDRDPMSPDSQVQSHRPACMVTLGLLPPYTIEDIKQAYLEKVKTSHPDTGGEVANFLKLQIAFDQARQYVEFRASRMSWLAAHMENYVKQSLIVDEVIRNGGRVETEQVDWLKESFGEDFAQVTEGLVGIDLHDRDVDDRMIEYLVREYDLLHRLRRLDFRRTRISDLGLKCLRTFTGLRYLDIRHTQISTPALKIVSWFLKLQWLGIERSRISVWDRLRRRWSYPDVKVVTDE